MEPGFPKETADDFPGIDTKVDAVFETFGKKILILSAVGHIEAFYGITGKRRTEIIFNNKIILAHSLLSPPAEIST